MPESLAQLIKRERARRHWSQKALAQESGIPSGTIAAYETEGTREPRAEHRVRLARVFQIPQAEIDAAIRGQAYEPSEGENGRAREFGRRVLDIMREMTVDLPVFRDLSLDTPVGHLYLPRRSAESMDRIGIELNTEAYVPQFNKGDIIDVDRAAAVVEGKLFVANHDGAIVLGHYYHNSGDHISIIGEMGRVPLAPGELIGRIVGVYHNYSDIPLV